MDTPGSKFYEIDRAKSANRAIYVWALVMAICLAACVAKELR